MNTRNQLPEPDSISDSGVYMKMRAAHDTIRKELLQLSNRPGVSDAYDAADRAYDAALNALEAVVDAHCALQVFRAVQNLSASQTQPHDADKPTRRRRNRARTPKR